MKGSGEETLLSGRSAGATGGEQALNQKPAQGVSKGAGRAGYRHWRQHRELEQDSAWEWIA